MFKVLVILSHWRLQTTLLNIPGHIGRCDLALRGSGLETTLSQECMTPVGLEPTIPGSVGRCLIHWATGPVHQLAQEHQVARHVRRLALLKASSCRSRDLCSLARTPPPLSPRFRRLSSRQSSQAGSQGITPSSCVSDRCALQPGSGHDPGRTRT